MEDADPNKKDELYKLRHSLAHILAQAVLELRPNSKLGFGPPVDFGCYYDFLIEGEPITEEDFPEIERRMRRIIKEDQPFIHETVPIDKAIEELRQSGQEFKVEYCAELGARGEKEIGFFTNGSFRDMCAGPHVESTGKIPPDCFKVDSIAGAYWRGSEENPQLTRIYVLAFNSKEDLEDFIKKRELARERDHRKLGRELDLFSVDNDYVGAGLILWHPNGAIVRHVIEEYEKKEHLQNGYRFVYTPHVGKSILWETSGHLSFFKENMYPPMELDNIAYYVKPMNCPFHCRIYASSLRSYKELPLRLAEWGTVYRYERSGTLFGITRTRGFTQDDAHIFCAREQMPQEIAEVLRFSIKVLSDFGFKERKIYLSTRPEKRVGADSDWEDAERALKDALENSGESFEIDAGEGAFYGPKIDITVRDAIGREWQLSTIQFDFNLPERFDLKYVDKNGSISRPYMVHRALCGSIERFFGILVEHYGGAFPTWLAPIQVAVICVADKFNDYGERIVRELSSEGIRAELDQSDASFNKKLRGAITRKIPNILIVGGREKEKGEVTWRRYGREEQKTLPLSDFKMAILDIVNTKE